jgi:dihydrofolate synthase/folylpolyglutamate synthase
MDYLQSLTYLRKLEKLGILFRLENTTELLEGLGFDWHGRVIHISGTNGKGSCASALNGILTQAGYNVGLYTSPELIDFTERIRVSGLQIPKRDLARVATLMRPLIKGMPNPPTFFEATTALALKHFEERKADALVLEVGMGGRLDSTNIIAGEVSIITNVALDHMRYLGDTVEKIAKEKAGIVSNGSVLVTGAEAGALRVLEEDCKRKGAAIIRLGQEAQIMDANTSLDGTSFSLRTRATTYPIKSPLPGLHQAQNLACAVLAAERLGIPKKHILSGIAQARWPGRLQVMQRDPTVILDCAHNPAGLKQARGFLSRTEYDRLIVVAGFSRDKDWKTMLEMLQDADELIATQYQNPRSLPAAEIQAQTGCKGYRDVKAAVRSAIKSAKEKDIVLVTGSIYVVGEAMRLWKRKIDVI